MKQHIGSEVNLCTGYCDVDRLSVKANTIRTEKRCVALQLCHLIILSIVFKYLVACLVVERHHEALINL